MPKVTDYELEHNEDFEITQKFKKKVKQVKEKKYQEKTEYRRNWKKQHKNDDKYVIDDED